MLRLLQISQQHFETQLERLKQDNERDAQMISYRNAAETQADLRTFCRWVVSGTVKLDDWPDSGKPRFAWKPKFPVCYTDASWVVPSMISKKGYFNRATRYRSSIKDKQC